MDSGEFVELGFAEPRSQVEILERAEGDFKAARCGS